MDTIKAFELKVGIFILIGTAILFLIVFSIGDISLARAGYRIKVLFNFANGMGGNAPVRLAGVGIGQGQGIRVFYDEKEKMTKAELIVWINDNARIERNAKFTINTLGLLGEKYLEIYPGTPEGGFLKAGDTVMGRDPVPMEKITEDLSRLSDSVTVIVERLKNGEGTIGKLLKEDAIYDDVKAITGNFKEFSEDIKRHPWKLLSKPIKESKK